MIKQVRYTNVCSYGRGDLAVEGGRAASGDLTGPCGGGEVSFAEANAWQRVFSSEVSFESREVI